MNISGVINLPSGIKNINVLSPATRGAVAGWRGNVIPAPLKAVVFDLGNVFANFYFGSASLAVCEREGIRDAGEISRVADVLLSPELKGLLEKGMTDFSGFYSRARERLGLRNTSCMQLERIWNNVFEIREDTASFAKDLRDSGVSTYLLSDTSPQHIRYLSGYLPVLGWANGKVFSYETGFYKSDGTHAFEKVIALMQQDGIAPNEAVYFDDISGYVAKAISLGLPAMTFLNAADARTIVREVWGLAV